MQALSLQAHKALSGWHKQSTQAGDASRLPLCEAIMARTMAVYMHRPSIAANIFRCIGLAIKLGFALGIGYAYIIIGFSL